MKPYLAVLYDSLLESVRSKVLWILLAAWTLLLAVLFPLSLSQGESYALTSADISSASTILDQLASASAGKGTRSQRAIYAKLDTEMKDLLVQRQNNKRRIFIGKLIDSFNKVLKEKDLYDKQAWPTADKRPQLKPLIEKSDRTEKETERLNRNLIDLSFPGLVKSSQGQAVWITYAGIQLGGALPITEHQIKPVIETMIFPLVMRFGLGIAAIFIAIIITSSMIPDMFQTGSLHLLLSKPLSRNLLFLTKFLGGCIFVAFNILFVLVGLYLYAGTRLGIWNNGILWCIPLFIFMFMIFYSVSALVGLVWKNAIISVVVTAVFWGLCFGMGQLHFWFDLFLNLQTQPQRVYNVSDTPVITTQQGRLQFWDEEKQNWTTGFGDVDGLKVLGPLWLPKEKAIFYARPPATPFGIASSQDVRLEMVRVPELTDPSDKTFDSKIWADGRLDSGPNLPSEPLQMLPWKDTFVVLNETGLYRYDSELVAKLEQQKSIFSNFNFGLPIPSEAYVNMTPKDWQVSKPIDIGVSPNFQHVVIYSRGKLLHFRVENDKLEKVAEETIDIRPETVSIVATNEHHAILCSNGEVPKWIDLQTLKVDKALDQLGKTTIRQIRTNGSGSFALLTMDGHVWTVDSEGNQIKRPSIAGQGKALAIHFNSDGNLWVAHSGRKVDLVDLATDKSIRSLRPRTSASEFIFNYFIHPLYEVNPKPAAVNETIEHVLKNPENKNFAIDKSDLETISVKTDPWKPIWTNLLFITVMLSISCWCLYRQDL